MEEPAHSIPPDVLDHAWDSAQRLAMDVIEYAPDLRDEVMRRMGVLLTEIAHEAGCAPERACEFGATMEQTIRDVVADIEASGGGTVGTA